MPIYRIAGKVILFIHVPKAAGTSIEAWLDQYGRESFRMKRRRPEFPCVPQHWHGELLEDIFAEGFFDYAFCVVRNPFSRLLSEYKYRITRPRLKNKILPKPGFPAWTRRTFSAFERDPYLYSNHVRPQSDFLAHGAEVFRVEDELPRLRIRLQEVCGIEMSAAFPTANISPRSSAQTYDPATAERALAFYKADFDRLGYGPETWKAQEKREVAG